MKRALNILFPIAAIVASTLGCKDVDNRDYALDVYVTIDEGEIKAQNVLVYITAPVENTFIDYYLYTNEEGKVSIELENKAIVEIVANKQPYKGCDFAELDRGVTTVTIDMKNIGSENGCRDDQ